MSNEHPYFLNRDAWDRFTAIVQSWHGTPYKHITMVKGRGADCALFIGACLVEARVLTKVTHDYYPKDWYIHCTEEMVLNSLYNHFQNHVAPGFWLNRHTSDTPLIRGDILTMTFFSKRRISNHAALYMGNNLATHASPRKGVIEVKYGPWMESHVTNVFRVMYNEAVQAVQ